MSETPTPPSTPVAIPPSTSTPVGDVVTQPEPSCPKCGETPMFRSVVHDCCTQVEVLQTILDRAYREWQAAGCPAGEGVVHLAEFQRAGLWRGKPTDEPAGGAS